MTGRSARWRCHLFGAGGRVRSPGLDFVQTVLSEIAGSALKGIAGWVAAAAVARQVCEKSINFITFEPTREKNRFAL